MQDPETKEMSFVDHLEELRWHVMRSVGAVVLFTIASFATMDLIFQYIILAPARGDFWTYRMLCKLAEPMCVQDIEFHLQNRTVAGQFTMHMVAAFVSGLVVAFPYIVWELWRFIKPGLHVIERKNSSGAVLFVSALFTVGIVFGYFIVAPLSLNFLLNYKLDPGIENMIDLSSYISFLCMIVLGSGLMFQLPVVIYILSRIGIIGPVFLRKYRKHSIVGIFILAAVLTPSPDLFTQFTVAIPLILLYELSIFLSAAITRRKEKELESL